MDAGAGPHVDDEVGRQDGIVIVLHHDHGVADVAQCLECGEQAIIVALVQADGRLVEHIHDAGQARADLAREADALRFAAGQRLRRAVEREIVESDVGEKAQAIADLADDLIGDGALGAGELERVEEIQHGAQAACG